MRVNNGNKRTIYLLFLNIFVCSCPSPKAWVTAGRPSSPTTVATLTRWPGSYHRRPVWRHQQAILQSPSRSKIGSRCTLGKDVSGNVPFKQAKSTKLQTDFPPSFFFYSSSFSPFFFFFSFFPCQVLWWVSGPGTRSSERSGTLGGFKNPPGQGLRPSCVQRGHLRQGAVSGAPQRDLDLWKRHLLT